MEILLIVGIVLLIGWIFSADTKPAKTDENFHHWFNNHN